MALANRTVNMIQRRLIPGAATELINAINGLNTTLSDDLMRRLNARMLRGVVVALSVYCAGTSIGTNILLASTGADAIFLRGIAQWLGDMGAAQDVLANLATVQ